MEIVIRKRKVRAVQFTPEQQRYIDEHYLLLPVDADGVPIHVGDEIEYGNGTRDKVRFIVINEGEPTFNERGWCPNHCHHVKPDPIKELLEEFAGALEKERDFRSHPDMKYTRDDVIAEYAEKFKAVER